VSNALAEVNVGIAVVAKSGTENAVGLFGPRCELFIELTMARTIRPQIIVMMTTLERFGQREAIGHRGVCLGII
jgi:hypothetical protein